MLHLIIINSTCLAVSQQAKLKYGCCDLSQISHLFRVRDRTAFFFFKSFIILTTQSAGTPVKCFHQCPRPTMKRCFLSPSLKTWRCLGVIRQSTGKRQEWNAGLSKVVCGSSTWRLSQTGWVRGRGNAVDAGWLCPVSCYKGNTRKKTELGIGSWFKTALLCLSLKQTALGWRESFGVILHGLVSEPALGAFSVLWKKRLSTDEAKLINSIILNIKTTGYPRGVECTWIWSYF